MESPKARSGQYDRAVTNYLKPVDNIASSYIELRGRVVTLLRTVAQREAKEVVPTTPDWTFAELAAHIVGVPEDVLAGRLEGVGSDAWTAAQVDRHTGDTLVQLAEFLVATSSIDAMLPSFPQQVLSQFVMDAVNHEQDMYLTLGRETARESDAVHAGLGFMLNAVHEYSPELATALSESLLSPWELLRTLSGRRTAEQIRAIDGIDAEKLLEFVQTTPMRPPLTTVEE